MSAFHDLAAIPPQLLAAGYRARAVHGERLTLAVVEIEPNAELPEHRHENEQLGIVIEGSVIFRVGDEERSLGAGGIWRIPPVYPIGSRPVRPVQWSSTSSRRCARSGKRTNC